MMETREVQAVSGGERRDRDRELVRLIGRHGGMTLKQVMRAMEVGGPPPTGASPAARKRGWWSG